MTKKSPQHLVRKQKAAELIAEHIDELRKVLPFRDVNRSAQDAGRRMVQVFWLLTGEMPQVADLDLIDLPSEPPAIEFVSPSEREDPDSAGDIVFVHPGLGIDPDIIIQGDQYDQEEDGGLSALPEEDLKLLSDPQARKEWIAQLQPPTIPPKPDKGT
jgi:hypothetical protein